jgi:hypothetical protein
VLKLLETDLIIGLAILGRRNSLVAWEVALLVLVGEVILACTDDEWLDCLAFRIDRLNYCNPFLASRLH